MSKWQQVKLGDVCSKIGSGATPKGGATVYVENGTSLIRSQNVYNLRFEYSGLTFITDDAAKKLSGVTIQPNDVLINITGDSVARTCIVPTNVIPARVNQHVAILRTKQDVLNPKYLNYFLASPQMQAHMLGLAVGKGASRNAMTKGMIENFTIQLPPLEVQRKIADVLSAYDDLIENNRKQIKLLEEAAQRLYKEWFIDLRFPGHETTPIIDGIPEGWEKKKLGEWVNTFSGGTPSRKNKEFYQNGSNFWLKTQELTDSFIFETEEKITDRAIEYSSAKYIYPNSIIMAMYGATIGKLGIAATTLTCNQACCVFDLSSDSKKMPYLYLWLKSNRDFFISQGIGSAQSNLSQAMIKNFDIIVPCQGTLSDFSPITTKIFAKILKLQKSVNEAKNARDCLLPKLINSELEVK